MVNDAEVLIPLGMGRTVLEEAAYKTRLEEDWGNGEQVRVDICEQIEETPSRRTTTQYHDMQRPPARQVISPKGGQSILCKPARAEHQQSIRRERAPDFIKML